MEDKKSSSCNDSFYELDIAADNTHLSPGSNITHLEYITKDIVLDKSEDVFSEFFGSFKYNVNYTSPLRCDDGRPSFRLFKHKSGLPWFKDFGYRHGNAIDFVCELYGIDFYNALVLINNRLGMGYDYNSNNVKSQIIGIPKTKKTFTSELESSGSEFEINILTNKYESGEFLYTNVDLNYWGRMFITRDRLLRHKTVSINRAYRNSNLLCEYSHSNPVYAYLEQYGDRWYTKLYRPFEKEGWKFYSDMIGVSDMVLHGVDLLPAKVDKLIITKSAKDVMCFEHLEHWSVGLQGEDMALSRSMVEHLGSVANEIVVFLDNDYNKDINRGIMFAKKLVDYLKSILGESKPISMTYIPTEYECTDISDVLYKYSDWQGAKQLIDILV